MKSTGNKKTLFVVVGPTAVGKTIYAINLAIKHKAEVVSCDSRQFYKGLTIGTAAPTAEELAMVKHHFIGHLDISEYYNVSKFEEDVLALLPQLFDKSDFAVMVGGSGLYIDAVCNGIDLLPDPDIEVRANVKHIYEIEGVEGLAKRLKSLDEEYYNEVDRNNPNRMMRALEVCIMTGEKFSELRRNQKKSRDFDIVKIGLSMDREALCDRINKRVDAMIDNGLVDEARGLYPFRDYNSLNTVGYRELFEYFDGNCQLDFAIEKIKTNSRRYAKRQMTWFRRYDDIEWINK